jgi:glycosyltransferase involved in cell wall biosynthesis
MRLFIFESHPVQYHAPVYRQLHRLCQSGGIGSVHVYYATDVTLRGHFDPDFRASFSWDEPLLEGYPASILNNENGVPLQGFHSLTGKGIPSLLRRIRPNAVLLTGLAYRFDWTTYVAALSLGIPVWLRTETQDKAFKRGLLKSMLRACFYRMVYLPVHKAFTIGKLNADHYERHGLPGTRQSWSRYCVVDRFANVTAEQAASLRQQVRAEAGFREDQTVLMFCGKLQPKKFPEALLEALARLSERDRGRFGVLYVGSGELENELRLRARSLRGPRVWFTGFKNQTELPPYYLASDVLVLPSRQMGETCGLVVNEALLAGLRVIVSNHAGCHADFGQAPGVQVFDGSAEHLAEALQRLPRKKGSGELTREFMKDYSVRAAAEGIAQAMRSIPASPADRPSKSVHETTSGRAKPALDSLAAN